MLSAGQTNSFDYLFLSALVLAISIFPWCVCMGATFPLMMAYVRERDENNQESFSYLIPLLAVISVNLGILNLLPVPILDGGVIIFLLIELFLRKPISFKKRDLAQKAGLLVLALLIVVVTINDLSRIEFFRKLFERFFG